MIGICTKRLLIPAAIFWSIVWTLQVGAVSRDIIVFDNIDVISIYCIAQVPKEAKIEEASFERSIEDLMLITIKSKLPKVKIKNSSTDALLISINCVSDQNNYGGSVELSLNRHVSLERYIVLENTKFSAPVYQTSFSIKGGISGFESHVRECVEELLVKFIADFYKARPDL